MADVARGLHDKLVSRHPHVFGEAVANDAAAVLENWEEAKVAEKNRESVMDGIPVALPALTLAEKILKKGQRVAPVDLTDEALRSLASSALPTEESIASALLATVELARRNGIDPEGALRNAATAAMNRFRAIERLTKTDHPNWILG